MRTVYFKTAALAGLIALWATPAFGSVVDEARKSLEAGDFATVASLMEKEIDKNPGDEDAYELLARALEGLDKKDRAAEIWGELKRISSDEQRIAEARIGLLRTRGPQRPGKREDGADPFYVDVGVIDYDMLSAIDTVTYVEGLPPGVKETRNFVVFAPNDAIAKEISDLCEKYLQFLLDKFLDGRAWAHRIPIMFYKNHDDYVSAGGYDAGSAGGTVSDRFGRTDRVALYVLDESGRATEDSIIGTLPHELTHVIINEYFGAQDTPLWLHEAFARRMEQNRKHYEEAAKTGRDAVSGEYYRFRDLFEAKQYPDGWFRVWRFYEQSATIVLYLLEQGPESTLAFIDALKQQKGHDEAVAAALGIPVEGAVEEFEKRWLDWIKERYVHDLSDDEKDEAVSAAAIETDVYGVGDSEIKTAEAIKQWTPISTDSLDKFKGIGKSLSEWKADEGRLVYEGASGEEASALGIRMDEEPPMVLRFKVRWNGTPGRETGYFGVGMLDHRGDDTGISVLTEIEDRRPHTVTCVVTDELAIYLDGQCMGRAPALRTEEIGEDIDYPLCLITYSPVQVFDMEAGLIETFVEATIAKAGDETGGG